MADAIATVEIVDNVSETSDPPRQASTSPSSSAFKLMNVLENLILMGMCSLDMWDLTLNKLKANVEIISDPEIFNLYCLLRDLFNNLSNAIYTKCDVHSQDKLPIINMKEMACDEIMEYLKPTLKKSTYKKRMFSSKGVHTLMKFIDDIIRNEYRPEEKKRKIESEDESEPRNISKKSKPVESEADDDEFEKIFSESIDKFKPVLIKQVFHYQTGNERRRLTTPGETGDVLIKIEMTNMKDLQKCKLEKNYWTKVSKKVYFVVNRGDKTLKDVEQIVLMIGKKISKIPEVASHITDVEERK